MRINSLNKTNTNNKPSFGRVDFQNYGNWWVVLSKHEPDIVSVEGFKDFTSKNAEVVTNKFIELGEQIANPENFKKIREHLLAIVNEAKENLPLFQEEDAKLVRNILNDPNPEINVKLGDAVIGDL